MMITGKSTITRLVIAVISTLLHTLKNFIPNTSDKDAGSKQHPAVELFKVVSNSD
jgi:hypothetical protein